MPASTPPSLNHNSFNTRTGHSNRCVFVGITHAEKEATSVNVVSVMKPFFSPENMHTYAHCGLRCCNRFSCSIAMSTEGFGSGTRFMTTLYIRGGQSFSLKGPHCVLGLGERVGQVLGETNPRMMIGH